MNLYKRCINRRLFLLLSTLALTHISIAQEKQIPEFIGSKLDAYILEAMDDWQIPGMAVCIVKDNKVLLNRGYGVAEHGTQIEVDENTLFLIGSITKAFTATAMTQLAIEHEISLNDPVKHWLPELELSDPWLTANVTIQDLLSHRSGLNKYAGDFMFFDTDFSSEDYMAHMKHLPITHEFRSFAYTNVGYFLIGQVIKSVSNTTYPEYIQSKLFDPLGMSRSGVIPSNWEKQDNHASPHSYTEGSLHIMKVGKADNMAASGGIYSSSSDLSKWLMAQLDDGRLFRQAGLSPELTKLTVTPKVVIGKAGMPYTMFNRSQFEHYASGWYNMDYEGRELITHNGGMYGFSSSVSLVPEINLGIAILTNADTHLLFEALKLEIIDAFLGLPFRDYSGIGSRFYRQQQQRSSDELNAFVKGIKPLTNSDLLTEYEGIYMNEAYGDLMLSASNGHLELSFEHHPKLKGTLTYINRGEFLCEYNNSVYGIEMIRFKFQENRVEGLTLVVDPNVEPNNYSFRKKK